jgi:hypothetical protein
MEKISTWFKVLITWIVIIPDFCMSYYALRLNDPSLEIVSLVINFISTTVLFYIYVNADSGKYEEELEVETSKSSEGIQNEMSPLYKLAFGTLIEDMSVWLILFFALYNIVPLTLMAHAWCAKGII